MEKNKSMKKGLFFLGVFIASALCGQVHTAEPAIEMDTSHVVRTRNLAKDAYRFAVQLTEAPDPYLQDNRKISNESYTAFPFLGDVKGSLSCIGAVYLKTEPLSNILIVATRGTMYNTDGEGKSQLWGRDVLADLAFFKTSASVHGLSGLIHGGFSDIVESCYHSFYQAITKAHAQLVAGGLALNETQIMFTGHSLGAALATIIAPRFVNHNNNLAQGSLFPPLAMDQNRVKIVKFSSPNVGDIAFHNHVIGLISPRNILHFNCGYDVVSYVPPGFLGFEPLGITIQTLALERMADRGILHILSIKLQLTTPVNLLLNAHETPEVATLRRAFEYFKRDKSYQPSMMNINRNPVLGFLKPFFC